MSSYFGPRLALPWLRVAAYLLDDVILAVVFLTLSGALFSAPDQAWLFVITAIVIATAYHVGFVLRFGGTPPKMAMKFRVVREDGEPLLLDTALLRFLVILVTMLVPFGAIISFLIMNGDPQWRSLHDRIAGTIVVRE